MVKNRYANVILPKLVYKYLPKEDIQAYELALILPILLEACRIPGSRISVQAVEALPDEARRHFDLVEIYQS